MSFQRGNIRRLATVRFQLQPNVPRAVFRQISRSCRHWRLSSRLKTELPVFPTFSCLYVIYVLFHELELHVVVDVSHYYNYNYKANELLKKVQPRYAAIFHAIERTKFMDIRRKTQHSRSIVEFLVYKGNRDYLDYSLGNFSKSVMR